MIVANDRTRSKRLSESVLRELETSGVSAVAVLSEIGVRRMSLALQRVANETGRLVNAVPTTQDVDGRSVMVIVVTWDTTATVDDSADNAGDGDTDE